MTGDIRKHPQFASQFLKSPRDVAVYLPPGYEERKEMHYPVLYLQDGQNLFDPCTAFAGEEWRVDDTAEALIREGGLRPLIVVGVYNAGEERIGEYTPTPDAGLNYGGQAGWYGRMLVEELRPFINGQYRTLPGAENTGLGGSSLGGLLALYLGLLYQDVFGKLALMSPSVWWGQRAILGLVSRAIVRRRARIWLDIGTAEGSQPQRIIEDARRLRDALKAQGWREGEDLRYLEAADADHSEREWAKRVAPMLRFLYPA